MEAAGDLDGISVAIRIRPLSETEVANGQGAAFQCIPKYNQIGQLKDGQLMRGQTFDFDRVYDEQSTTNQIYTASARSLVMNVINGINGTIFACKRLFQSFFSVLSAKFISLPVSLFSLVLFISIQKCIILDNLPLLRKIISSRDLAHSHMIFFIPQK